MVILAAMANHPTKLKFPFNLFVQNYPVEDYDDPSRMLVSEWKMKMNKTINFK